MPSADPPQEIYHEYPLGAPILDPSLGHLAIPLAVLECCPISGDLAEPSIL